MSRLLFAARAPGPALLAGLALLACGGARPAATAPRPDLVTRAERSGWVHTGSHEEAVRLCRDFQLSFPGRARCERFGTTLEGRAMVALVAGDPAARRPVLLVQAGIHAGEIEGKDAGFRFLRELLSGRTLPGALDRMTIVFVPILNPDGHERTGPNNRPNQRGPAEMGFRTNSQNLNLNRDYMKVDTPELAAVLALWQRWDPVVYVDLHTTDGARFEHDVAVLVSPRAPRGDRLDEAARSLSDGVQERLGQLGHLPLDFYPAFVEQDDPASGFEQAEPPPRFSQGYAGLRGRLGVLVETHSWHDYRQRALATYHTLQALVERAQRDAVDWREIARTADTEDADLGGKAVPLAYRAGSKARTIEFRGYHYERRRSEVSGGMWIRYDEKRPQVWKVPLRDQIVPAVTEIAPRAGYLVTAGFADVVARRLDAHAIRYRRIGRALTASARVFRVTRAEYEPPFEGRTQAKLTGSWSAERRQVAPGALYIPIAQPRARVLMQLLEPAAPDSLAAWGFFNPTLEQKEYMEAYVAEEVAREMLADPAVRAAFEKELEDPAFAASPERRLEFFYRRHPSWDERRDLLPVYRLDAPP
jgi:hypothetical protein